MTVGTNIKVSVILPVYNVEPYIGRCIESLQTQTMRELEFIFVDDCSTDSSMASVEAWAEEDERVRILRNEENLGAGPSRNRGIEVARGEYLSFVDPDDYVSSDFYELLYTAAMKAGGCDIAKGVRVRINLPTGVQRPEVDMNKRIARFIKQGKPLYLFFFYGHQTALYRHTLFEDAYVRYGTSRNGQDVTFLLIVCSRAKTIVLNNCARYYYFYGREGAATVQYSFERVTRDLDALKQRIDYLLTQESSNYWYEYLVMPFCVYLNHMCLVRRGEGAHQEHERIFIEKISEQLARIPSYQKLLNSLPELDVLLKYGVFIPTTEYQSDASLADRLEGWISFLEKQNTLDLPYEKACSSAVMDYMVDALRRGDRHAFKYIKEQLRNLKPDWQRQIIAAVPKSFVIKLEQKIKQRLGA